DLYKDTQIYQFYAGDIDVSPTTGRIAVVGFAYTLDEDEPDYSGQYVTDNDCVILLNPNGTLVNSFGGNGIRFNGAGAEGGIHFGADGSTLFVPDTGNDHGSPYPVRMYKFKSDGSFIFKETAASMGSPFDSAVGPDGKFYVACLGDGAEIVRFNADGTPDRSYSGDAVAAAMGVFDYGGAIAIDPQGRVVFAGSVSSYPDVGPGVVARFAANPTGGGVTMTLKSDGTLIVTGTSADDAIGFQSTNDFPTKIQLAANHS